MIPSRFTLIALRGHCKLHNVGMRHSKITPTELRKLVEHATCEKFKRGDWKAMIASLDYMLDESKVISA